MIELEIVLPDDSKLLISVEITHSIGQLLKDLLKRNEKLLLDKARLSHVSYAEWRLAQLPQVPASGRTLRLKLLKCDADNLLSLVKARVVQPLQASGRFLGSERSPRTVSIRQAEGFWQAISVSCSVYCARASLQFAAYLVRMPQLSSVLDDVYLTHLSYFAKFATL